MEAIKGVRRRVTAALYMTFFSGYGTAPASCMVYQLIDYSRYPYVSDLQFGLYHTVHLHPTQTFHGAAFFL